MNNKILIALAIIVTVGTLLVLGMSAPHESSYEVLKPEEMADIRLDSNVFVSKNGVLVYEGHNVFTNAGKEHIEACLGTDGGCGADGFISIAVGNGTTPSSGDTTLNSEIAESGLERADGTYASTGTGAWKIEKIFSVTGTVNSVNTTGLFNATSAETLLAADDFTDTNVANGDSLNITWTVSVS